MLMSKHSLQSVEGELPLVEINPGILQAQRTNLPLMNHPDSDRSPCSLSATLTAIAVWIQRLQ
jgi:hypothetical protein